MNKHAGEFALSRTVTILIALVVLVVILATFFGERIGLLNKIADAGNSIADRILYNLKISSGTTQRTIQSRSDIDKTFDSLVEVMRTNTKMSMCLLRYNKVFSNLEDFEIELSKTDNGMLIKVINPRKQVYAEEIAGLEPCVIAGTKANPNIPKNFYYTFLAPKKKRKPSDNIILLTDKIKIIKNKLFSAEPTIVIESKKYDADNYGILFKKDDKHICLFATYDGNIFHKCYWNKLALDDDCLKMMSEGKHDLEALPFCR